MGTRSRLALLSAGVMLFHGINGLMVERAVTSDGFEGAFALTLVETTLAGLLTLAAAVVQVLRVARRAPPRSRCRTLRRLRLALPKPVVAVLGVGFCGSLWLSNESTSRLGYPGQVVLKSTKVFFVAFVRDCVLTRARGALPAAALGKPRAALRDVLLSCAMVALGISVFTLVSPQRRGDVAEAEAASPDASVASAARARSLWRHVSGFAAAVGSNALDAALYAAQEFWCFVEDPQAEGGPQGLLPGPGAAGEQPLPPIYLHRFHEVFMMTNALASALLWSAALLVCPGQRPTAASVSKIAGTVLAGSLSGIVGTIFFFDIISEYDGIAAVIVTNLRKMMSILVSLLMLQGFLTPLQGLSAACVLGGCVWYELLRERRSKD